MTDLMRRVRPAVALMALAGAAACNDPGFSGTPTVRVAEESEVASCAYVSNISYEPSVFGPLAQQGLKYSQNRILADAKEMGANNVVFEKTTPGIPVAKVNATAYRC